MMSYLYDMAKAYQEQLLRDAEPDPARNDAAIQKKKLAPELIRTALSVLKREPMVSQQRLDPASRDTNSA